MYPASALIDFLVILPLQQLAAGSTGPLSEFLWLPVVAPIWAVGFAYAAFTTTFWLTLPAGALGGYIHGTVERSPQDRNSPTTGCSVIR